MTAWARFWCTHTTVVAATYALQQMVLCDRDGVTLTDDDDDDGKVDSFVSKKEKRGTSKTGAGSDTNQNTLYLSSSDLQHPVLTAMIKKCSL